MTDPRQLSDDDMIDIANRELRDKEFLKGFFTPATIRSDTEREDERIYPSNQ